MGRKSPTLRDALSSPRFSVKLSPFFLERMARLEDLIQMLGKSDGIKEWSAQEVRAVQQRLAMERTSAALYAEDRPDRRGKDRYDLTTATGRNSLAVARRDLARWWLKVSGGMTVDELKAHPQVEVAL